MKSKTYFFTILIPLVLGFTSQAQAGLIGSSVNTQYYAYGAIYNGFGSPASFVANGTVQNIFSNYYALTVTDTTVEYDFLSDLTWSPSAVSLDQDGLFITNGNLLSFTNSPFITNVTFNDASSAVPGFNLTNVTFNGHEIAVDWPNVTFHRGDKVILDVDVMTPVPEPGTYAMLLIGLGLISLIMYRKKETGA